METQDEQKLLTMAKHRFEKNERVRQANECLQIIARHGRHFFRSGEKVSYFELDASGHIWFVDKYSGKRVYTHYTNGRWMGFSEGGTLRSLVIALRDYIAKGEKLGSCHFGPWHSWYSEGDPWGYGKDMQTVRDLVIKLGITK
jgi:hypothetical protein